MIINRLTAAFSIFSVRKLEAYHALLAPTVVGSIATMATCVQYVPLSQCSESSQLTSMRSGAMNVEFWNAGFTIMTYILRIGRWSDSLHQLRSIEYKKTVAVG